MSYAELLAKRCATHRKKDMGYIQWHQWAETKMRRGEQTRQCPKCSLWFFRAEFGLGWTKALNTQPAKDAHE